MEVRNLVAFLVNFTVHLFGLTFAKPIASEIFHRDFVHPPHCTRTPIIFGHFSRRDDTGQFDRNELMQLSIGLHTTACFRMDAGQFYRINRGCENAFSAMEKAWIRINTLKYSKSST